MFDSIQRLAFRTVVTALSLGAVSTNPASAGTLYAAEVWGQERLTTVDRSTAQQSTVGPFGSAFGPFGLAYNDVSSKMFMVDQAPSTKGLYSVDLSTGAATRVGAAGALGSVTPRGLGFDHLHNIMYTSNLDTNQLLSVSMTTGMASMVAPFVNFGAVQALTYDNTNNILWAIAGVVTGAGSGSHLVSINPATGLGTSVISLGTGAAANFRGLAYDPEQHILWTHNNSTGFLTKLDFVGGTVTPFANTQQPGQSGTSLNAIAYVPAPSTCLVIGIGMGLTSNRRRRA